jgi:hypothetical protein
VQLSNHGKDRASGLNLSLQLPEIFSYEGMEGDPGAKLDEESRTVALPAIGQLEPRDKSRTLRVRVKAQKAGRGVFTVALTSGAFGDARLSFESEPVTVTAKKSPAKKPVDASEAKPAKTQAKNQEKPKAKDQEEPAAAKAKAAPAKKEGEGSAKDNSGSNKKPAKE